MIFFTPRLGIAFKFALILALQTGASAAPAAALSPVEQTLLKQSSPAAWEARRQYRDIAVDTVGIGETRAYVFRPEARSLTGLPLVLFMHGWRGTLCLDQTWACPTPRISFSSRGLTFL